MSLYGLILGIAFVVCFEIFSRKNNLIVKNHEWLFFIGLIISAIIGARAYHVFDQWSFYSQNIDQIINIRGGGLGIIGGISGGFIFVLFYSITNKTPLLSLTNAIASVLPLGQSIGRWGNFANHEVYSPNGQPVWAYESLLDLLLFLLLQKYPKHQTAVYLIGYGTIRFFLEFLRNDTWAINSIKIGQAVSIIFIFTGILLYAQTKNSKK